MRSISLGYSPCPNDTFIFYAMVHGKTSIPGYSFNEILLDVESLNNRALLSELDITKVSYAAYGHFREEYCLLRSGGALGRGCGPLVVAKNRISMNELEGKTIAIPGTLTTANLLLGLFFSCKNLKNAKLIPMPFDKIMTAVSKEVVDAGLIIHESRFTYSSFGLFSIQDLGEWWEQETALPIPLGGIIGKRSLGRKVIHDISELLKKSVTYAFQNRTEPMSYIQEHSQELSEGVIKQHIDLYVNDFTIDIGDEGTSAVKTLLDRAQDAEIIPRSSAPLFL